MRKILLAMTCSYLFLGFKIASAEIVESGTNCGTNCPWSLDGEGNLTIWGTGANGSGSMSNYNYLKPAPWVEGTSAAIDNSKIKTVTIQNGITNIGNQVFYGAVNLTSVSIPSSVTSIGDEAFHDAKKITNINLPSSLKTIGFQAFHNTSLSSIDIPSTVTSIGRYAFNGTKLTDVIIPESVTNIEQYTFASVPLHSIVVGENTTFNTNNSLGTKNGSTLIVYCIGDTSKCDSNLSAAGYNLHSTQLTRQNMNGMTYYLDKNGNVVARLGERKNKRIYTVGEAELVSKPTGNKIMIRYK